MSDEYNELRRPRETAEISGASIMRVAASVLGIVIIIIGLVFAVRTFSEIRGSVREPESFREKFEKMVTVLGVEKSEIKFKDEVVPVAQVLGIVAIGGAYLLMSWLSIGIMVAGAKIISWSTGDREAIRKLIRESLGGRARV